MIHINKIKSPTPLYKVIHLIEITDTGRPDHRSTDTIKYRRPDGPIGDINCKKGLCKVRHRHRILPWLTFTTDYRRVSFDRDVVIDGRLHQAGTVFFKEHNYGYSDRELYADLLGCGFICVM